MIRWGLVVVSVMIVIFFSANYAQGAEIDHLIKVDSADKWSEELLRVARVETLETEEDYRMELYQNCTRSTHTVVGRNMYGWAVWDYNQQIDYCWQDGVLTSAQRVKWGQVWLSFWRFNGHIGDGVWGGPGSTYFRAWTQGSFSLCLTDVIGCVQHEYPVIDQTVYAQ